MLIILFFVNQLVVEFPFFFWRNPAYQRVKVQRFASSARSVLTVDHSEVNSRLQQTQVLIFRHDCLLCLFRVEGCILPFYQCWTEGGSDGWLHYLVTRPDLIWCVVLLYLKLTYWGFQGLIILRLSCLKITICLLKFEGFFFNISMVSRTILRW